MGFDVVGALRWWVRECPDDGAVSLDGDSLTFAELWGWSGRIAAHLQMRGLAAGARVAVAAASSPEYVALAFAMLRIGVISAPMSIRCTARELGDDIEVVDPALMFADQARMSTAVEAARVADLRVAAIEELRNLRAGADAAIVHEVQPDDCVFIIGTSGSTAKPKRVIYTHRMIVTYALEFLVMQPRCGRPGKALSLGPFSSTSGYLLLLQFITLGLHVFVESRFVPERCLTLIEQERITLMLAPPVFFERIAQLSAFAGANVSTLLFTQTAGARITTTLLKQWRDKGVVLRQAYGSAESGGAWAARDATAISEPTKCGHGGMFTDFAIRDGDGVITQSDASGEIVVRGPCRSPGYWRDPGATGASVKDGWLSNGDLGSMDESGELTFIDRLKDIVISGGLNISALEVENVLESIDGVDEAAVISAPDDRFGETPMAIVYSEGARVSVPAIIAHCNRHLADYKVPRYVVLSNEPLPRLPVGKVSKVDLRTMYKDSHKALDRVR